MIYIAIMSPSTVYVFYYVLIYSCLYNNFSRNLIMCCIINIYNPNCFFIGGTGTVEKKNLSRQKSVGFPKLSCNI